MREKEYEAVTAFTNKNDLLHLPCKVMRCCYICNGDNLVQMENLS